MGVEAVIRLQFSSERELRVVLKALKPETRVTLSHRCRARIHSKGNNLTLTLEARDTSALRAAANSYLRWILLTRAVLKSINLVGSKVKE